MSDYTRISSIKSVVDWSEKRENESANEGDGGRGPVIRPTISRKSVRFAGEIRWRAVSPDRESTLPILR